jgi:peroxiredoxin Q/BCP
MAELKEGDMAPAFDAIDHTGTKISLNELNGKKVILYFYPKDNTPGCTAEACNLRDNYHILKDKGMEIIGVSPDSEKSHNRFIEKYDLPFRLIPDPNKDILIKYGAWGEKKIFGKTKEGVLRKTFIISEQGVIEKIINKVDTKNHANQIIEKLVN